VKPLIFIGIATGIGMLLGWSALDQLDPSFTAFLGRFRPVLIIILSFIILGERLALKELPPIGLMVVGCVFSAVGRWEVVGIGIVLALSAAFMAAIQQVVAKIAVARSHPDIMVFYRVVIAALIIAIWNLLTGSTDFHVKLSYWLVLLLGAFLGPTLSFHFMYRAYRYWDLSKVSVVIIAQPLIVLPLAYLFLGKLPAQNELIGGFVIMGGAVWLGLLHFLAGKRAELPIVVPKQASKNGTMERGVLEISSTRRWNFNFLSGSLGLSMIQTSPSFDISSVPASEIGSRFDPAIGSELMNGGIPGHGTRIFQEGKLSRGSLRISVNRMSLNFLIMHRKGHTNQ
jgi:drug/metabolite transporter (DMT)-like permease